MTVMFEESVESFTSRWQGEAVNARVFSRVENDPLLELEASGVILHALERTGPYVPKVGENRVIVHALCTTVEAAPAPETKVEITGISRMHATGQVARLEQPILVVDLGFPLVLGVLEPLGAVSEGDWISFTALPPLQAFVLEETVRNVHDHEL